MHRALSAVALVGALALAGCSGAEDGGSSATEASGSGSETAAADPTGSETSGTDATESASAQSDPAAVPDGTRELAISERHPNGTVLDVTGLTIDGRTLVLNAEFFASGPAPITIAVEGGTAVRLKGSDGTFYRLVPPEDVEDEIIELAPGESIGGTWSFRGPLQPGTTAVTLMVNMYEPSVDPNQYDRATRTEFYVEIPLA